MIDINDEKIVEIKKYIAETATREYPDSYLIAVLHKAQSLYGYLDREVLDIISDEMNIPTAHIWGVATFYHYFNLEPVGKHIVSICMGTACYVNGGDKILETLKRELAIESGQTTDDGLFTLQEARCLGACGIAPVIMIDDKIYGELDEKKTINLINQFRKAAQ